MHCNFVLMRKTYLKQSLFNFFCKIYRITDGPIWSQIAQVERGFSRKPIRQCALQVPLLHIFVVCVCSFPKEGVSFGIYDCLSTRSWHQIHHHWRHPLIYFPQILELIYLVKSEEVKKFKGDKIDSFLKIRYHRTWKNLINLSSKSSR